MITPAGASVGGLIMTSVGGIFGGRMITPFPEAARNPTAPVRTVRAKPHTAIHLFINPSEREIRSRGVYVRFRAIPRKYLRGVCPNGTHPSLGIGQSRFPKLSTDKIELGIESGQCYQRTIAANRLGSSTSDGCSGLSGFPRAGRPSFAEESLRSHTDFTRLLSKSSGTSPAARDNDHRAQKRTQEPHKNTRRTLGVLASRWSEQRFARAGSERKRHLPFHRQACEEGVANPAAVLAARRRSARRRSGEAYPRGTGNGRGVHARG
jgi:hypothetical protein